MLFIQAGVGAVTSNNDRYTLRFLLAYSYLISWSFVAPAAYFSANRPIVWLMHPITFTGPCHFGLGALA